jgi:hypothetical protein
VTCADQPGEFCHGPRAGLSDDGVQEYVRNRLLKDEVPFTIEGVGQVLARPHACHASDRRDSAGQCGL